MCAVVHAVTKLDTYEQLNNKPKVKTNEFLLRCLKKKALTYMHCLCDDIFFCQFLTEKLCPEF